MVCDLAEMVPEGVQFEILDDDINLSNGWL